MKKTLINFDKISQMDNNKKNNLQPIKRDYDKELKNVFSEALEKIDPEIMQAIELVQKMNMATNNQIQITISSSGSGTSFYS